MIRTKLRWVAGAVLVLGTFLNLQTFDFLVATIPARPAEDVTVLENQFLSIGSALIKENYGNSRVGYMTGRTLQGAPPDDPANIRWGQLRYIMIPWVLVTGTDEPYVIGDFKKGEPVPAVPGSLVKIYDSGNGMILYKRKPTP